MYLFFDIVLIYKKKKKNAYLVPIDELPVNNDLRQNLKKKSDKDGTIGRKHFQFFL